MKKAKSRADKMRPEYKLSDFKKLERGKYYARVKESSNVVVLDPEVAAVFPNSDAVNEALHSLIEVGSKVSHLTSASNHPTRLRRSSELCAQGRKSPPKQTTLGWGTLKLVGRATRLKLRLNGAPGFLSGRYACAELHSQTNVALLLLQLLL